MINNYLLNRENLACLFVLIDSRHKPQAIDQEFMEFLAEEKIPFALTFTKGDKLTKNEIWKNIEDYKCSMLKKWEKLPEVFITSAEKKTGVLKITTYIENLNTQFR